MKPGPRKEPTALKVLKGAARTDSAEPKPQPVAPSAPAWLKPDAKKLWKQLAPKLERMNLLTEVDGAAFAGLCESWAIFVEASKRLKAEGLTRRDENNVERKNPCLQIVRESLAQFRQFAAEFGLTPAARAGLDIDITEENDPFHAMFGD